MATATGSPTRQRAFVGASVANAIEWYDFAVYGFVAASIGANSSPRGTRRRSC